MAKIQIGEVYTSSRGVKLTVVDYSDITTKKVIVEDFMCRRRVVWVKDLKSGVVGWFKDKMPVFKVRKLKPEKAAPPKAPRKTLSDEMVGRSFTLNNGVTVKVVESSPLTVEDGKGNRKEVKRKTLLSGNVSWREFGVASIHKGTERINIGDAINLTCGVPVKMVEYIHCDNVIVEDDYGNRKATTMSQLRKGMVSWADFGVRTPTSIHNRVNVGMRRLSKRDGWYEVVEVNSCFDIRIKWDSCGSEESVGIYSIDNNSPSKDWNYLGVNPDKHYVYYAINRGDIVYIGKGTYNRYLHVNSGRSHSYGLNSMHFAGEDLKVIIYRDCLSSKDASLLERDLILKYSPSCNIMLKGQSEISSGA